MAWFSILPDNLSTVEAWAARIFILLGVLTIGPWALLIIYDLLLYSWRSATHEIPVIGGRARGRQRPRAPSLTERPSGHRRKFSLAVPSSIGEEDDSDRSASASGKDSSADLRARHSDSAVFEE
ncbi:hypothetical protein W97_04131 [Coniosporium apollinis CBS 100218]|uniref:Uncharacterized protein n=1 Tax=Coniosporium apollinis (strain CBS 100218) TaxID=1168221 RepID=R7YSI7_CONA1|nr:uncharacterized protein W97_04131 [Coniosporium apollinis CBS 100218]EON64897.1 hypothetical protein W97_04131 [Coniosporium apollinis CBS 100218]